MKRFIVLGMVWGWSSLCAQTAPVTLDEILTHAKPSKLIQERLTQEAMARQAENLATTQEEPINLHHALSWNNGVSDDGLEHEVELSKAFIWGDIQRLEQAQNRLNNEAYVLEESLSIVEIENHLKNLYHQHCLDDAYLQSLQEAYERFVELYAKKEVAFDQGEIAKTELLQLELERSRLAIELQNREAKEQSSRELLLSLTSLPYDALFSCNDTYSIVPEVSMNDQVFTLSQEAYEKRIESTKLGMARYGHKVESVELSLGYSKELESDIYTLGVSVPLSFTTKRSEYAKASLMHQASALELKRTEEISKKSYEVRRLYEHLRQNYMTIQAQEQNIENYQNRLLPLMKKSYDYGESSVIEYLLSQQRLYALEQELLNQKRDYYNTLFELYTVSEIKEKQ